MLASVCHLKVKIASCTTDRNLHFCPQLHDFIAYQLHYIYSLLFTAKYRHAHNWHVHCSSDMFQQFCHTPADHFSTSPHTPLVLFFYSLPLGRDLWTTVRWPTGQHAATGGKVMTSGPMYGTNAASRHVCRCTEWPPVKLTKVDHVACHWPWQ